MAAFWLLPPPEPPRTAFDDFDRSDESPAVGWNMGTGGFFPRIVSNALTNHASGSALNALQRGKVDGDAPEFWYGPDQWARTYLKTVSTENAYANGPGPAVRVLASSSNKGGYAVAVNTTRATLYRASSAVFLGEWAGGADGDVWELQVWGPPSATWLRIIRNDRIIATVRDDQSAVGDVPANGLPGIYCINGAIERFECGSLPRMAVPWFVSVAAPITADLNKAQSAQTVSADASVLVVADLSATQGAQTLSADGSVLVVADLSATQAANTLDSSGTIEQEEETEEPLPVQPTGGGGSSATLTRWHPTRKVDAKLRQAPQRVVATASVLIQADLSQTQRPDVLVATAHAAIDLSMVVRQGANKVQATASRDWSHAAADDEAAMLAHARNVEPIDKAEVSKRVDAAVARQRAGVAREFEKFVKELRQQIH